MRGGVSWEVTEGLPSKGTLGETLTNSTLAFPLPGLELSRFVQDPPASHDASLWVQSHKEN